MSNDDTNNNNTKDTYNYATPPLLPNSPQEISTFSALDLALRSHPELAKDGAKILNPRALSRLVEGVRYFQYTHLGRKSKNSTQKQWPMVRLPDDIFRNKSPTGPLFTAILSAYRHKKECNWKQFDFVAPKRFNDNMNLLLRMEKDLLEAKQLKRPIVYLDESVPKGKVQEYERIIQQFGGRVVYTMSDSTRNTNDWPTHIIGWDETEHDTEATLENETRIQQQGLEPEHLFLRTLTVVDPLKFKKMNSIVESNIPDSKKKGGKVKGNKAMIIPNLEDPMALVHWWYFPSSYDEWMLAADVAGDQVATDEDLESLNGSKRRKSDVPFVVASKFVRDVEVFNEWGVEADYVIQDFEKTLKIYKKMPQAFKPQIESVPIKRGNDNVGDSVLITSTTIPSTKTKETSGSSLRINFSIPSSSSSHQLPTSNSEEVKSKSSNEKVKTTTVNNSISSTNTTLDGMKPKQIMTGYYDSNGIQIRQTVYDGALKIPSYALDLVKNAIRNVDEDLFNHVTSLNTKYELPSVGSILKPSDDPDLEKEFQITELRGGVNGHTITVTKTLGIPNYRIRGGGDDDDNDIDMADVSNKEDTSDHPSQSVAQNPYSSNSQDKDFSAFDVRSDENASSSISYTIENSSSNFHVTEYSLKDMYHNQNQNFDPFTNKGSLSENEKIISETSVIDIRDSSAEQLKGANMENSPKSEHQGALAHADNPNLSNDTNTDDYTSINFNSEKSNLELKKTMPNLFSSNIDTAMEDIGSGIQQENVQSTISSAQHVTTDETSRDEDSIKCSISSEKNDLKPEDSVQTSTSLIDEHTKDQKQEEISSDSAVATKRDEESPVEETDNDLKPEQTSSLDETIQSSNNSEKKEELCSIISLPPKSSEREISKEKLPLVGDQEPTTELPPWYNADSVSELEMITLPEWFNKSAQHRSQSSYIKTREKILELGRRSTSQYLTATAVRRAIPGDIGSLLRLHQFLTSWGFINGSAIDESTPTHPEYSYDMLSNVVASSAVATTSSALIGNVSNSELENKAKSRRSLDKKRLITAVSTFSSKKRKISENNTDDSSFITDWEAVADMVGDGVSPSDCYREFISINFDDVTDDTEMDKDETDSIDGPYPVSEKVKLFIKQQFLHELIDGVPDKVIEATTKAALEASNGNLVQAQKASILGIIASKAQSQAENEERSVEHLMNEILNQRMLKLENRLSMLDDLEDIFDAERVSLEIERRDLYTARCRHWFSGDK